MLADDHQPPLVHRTLLAASPPRLRGRRAATVAAIVECLVPSVPALETEVRAAVVADVVRFVSSQVAALPDFLRAPYGLALVGFEWLPLLRWGRPFGALDSARQAAYLDHWSDAPIGAMRNFVKLMRSCALLAYYDHPALAAALAKPANPT